jgi:hypothetical protein
VDDTWASSHAAARLARRAGIAVVVAVPEKFTIYPEHLPAWVAKRCRRRTTASAPAWSGMVASRSSICAHHCSPPTRERVYFQTDSHGTTTALPSIW